MPPDEVGVKYLRIGLLDAFSFNVILMKVFSEQPPAAGLRMGRFGGEMSLLSKLWRIDALFTSHLRGAATEC